MTSVFFPQTIDLSASAIQLIRTALANPHVVLDKNGLRATDSSGAVTFSLDALSGDIRGGKLLLGVGSPWIEWLNDLAQAEPVESGSNLVAQTTVSNAFATPPGGGSVPDAEMSHRVFGATSLAFLDLISSAAHPDLAGLYVELNPLTGAASPVKVIAGDGTSDFVQKRDATYAKTAAPSVAQPVVGRPYGVYRAGAAYGLVAGWQGISWDTFGFDGSNAENMWQGQWVAPVTGFYRYTANVLIQNATGSTIELVLGYNSSGRYVRTSTPTTLYAGMNYSETMYLGAGAVVNPTVWVSAVAGFGVSLQPQCFTSFQRVA